jgi:hypothetical protein
MLGLFDKLRIDDVSTETFNLIIKDLVELDWNAQDKYKEFNAWIDYGKAVLTKDGVKLIFEWDNWTEGVIKGPKKVILKIVKDYDLKEPSFVLF